MSCYWNSSWKLNFLFIFVYNKQKKYMYIKWSSLKLKWRILWISIFIPNSFIPKNTYFSYLFLSQWQCCIFYNCSKKSKYRRPTKNLKTQIITFLWIKQYLIDMQKIYVIILKSDGQPKIEKLYFNWKIWPM